ncbi:probable SKI2 - antiviral protein and putative helicase [Melanopsichium pennsylvanicum]|uniref:Probable SKI2 - antiviral protein and putative helicase n=2 Tax=Melanopsichium pennsylvanicum TaxID=63383 RepID=A0AAJ4XID4_9BASI|nr:probable SKI2-putative RNA helicase, involved in exosome mediated 3` to 5` mRNA degradation [Melanopsichium pennsylvanicum 4]SNX81713.1 probable SKI2 - antiviral protein and putative helicase [Melanopsichium pennsylvanicum]
MSGATDTSSGVVEAYNTAIASLRSDTSVSTCLPSLFSGPDTIESLIDDFLTPSQKLSARELARSQVHWERKPKLEHMLWAEPAKSLHSLEFIRAGLEGRIVSYREVSHTSAPLLDSKSSASMARKPATFSNFVRGKSAYVPFAPGGLENEVMKDVDCAEAEDLSDTIREQVADMEETLSSGRGLRSKAPGLSRSFIDPKCEVLDGEEDEDRDASARVRDAAQAVDVGLGMAPIPVYRPVEQGTAGPSTARKSRSQPNAEASISAKNAELDELLPVERPQPLTHARRSAKIEAKRDWAHVVDVNQKLTNFRELVPQMAHTFPFELDTFQKEAVYHLEQGDSVFVAAHTSAGKTVVAEYAIALAQKHMTRCIYTSPIKALSNQKYRDFKQTFGAANVGILTGDVQINPEAPCLIMTTEILRSMLYRGADLIRDVEFVIFDEVHYVNDQERGVVWEEVIILCPQHINLILLSATVPNTKEFADWVGRTKKKDIYVISTPKRPVPLEHFLYAGKEMFKIVDARAQFLGSGIKEAGEALKRKQEKEREANAAAGGAGGARGGRGGGSAGSNSRGRGGMTPARGAAPRGRGGAVGNRGGFIGQTTVRTGLDKNLWVHLVGNLKKKDLLPCVVFVFSKKRCEEYATSMPNTDLNTAKEKSEVHIVIEKSLTRLKGTDKELPQIKRMRDLLSRGIGVHHGGLLPIVKEIVELLFQRGLVKVLFATETFAMGVNMPARSVVFSSIRKHDGHGFRELLPGEYTQMSGRAGRRGLDATGVVIINAADQLPETAVLHKMLLGQPTKLQSQFRLTYNMILNLLRVEALKVEEMIKRSFSENAAQKILPDQQRKAQELEKKLTKAPRPQPIELDEELATYHDLCAAVVTSNQSLFELSLGHQQGAKNFSAGRVVILRDGHFDFDVGAIVRQVSSKEFLVLAAVTQSRKKGDYDVESEDGTPPLWPPRVAAIDNPQDLVYDLREVPLTSISYVTDHTIKLEVPLITAHRISAMNRALSSLVSLHISFSSEDSLREAEWSKLKRLDFQEVVRSRDSYARKVDQHLSLLDSPDFTSNYAMVARYKTLTVELERVLRLQSDENLELLPDYEQRVSVLKTLRYVDPITESVLLKGRVACEVNSANELVLTELILENVLVDYEPEEVVALLSIFITQEKTDDIPALEGRLLQGYDKILEIAERISSVQLANHLASEDFTAPNKIALVGVVYEWAKGTDFATIAAMTDIQEGSIVRVITRLDETCREIRDAARVIGDRDLGEKIQTCQTLIRRDIVFAASLYF